jgi:hypothetical protein
MQNACGGSLKFSLLDGPYLATVREILRLPDALSYRPLQSQKLIPAVLMTDNLLVISEKHFKPLNNCSSIVIRVNPYQESKNSLSSR